MSDDYQYDVYHGSKDTPLGKYKDFNVSEDTVIIVNTGGIGGVKFLDKKAWCSDGSFWLENTDAIMPKFLYYSLSGYEEYFASKKRVGGVPTIDREVIENFEISIPPLEKQKEIVKLLDKFSKYCSDLKEGLPAEIEARQKQYEYYRDKLLTFKELEA